MGNTGEKMKYVMPILIILLFAADYCVTTRIRGCKTVDAVGGCNRYSCGVMFTDGTNSDAAMSPVTGMTMCLESDGYYRRKE